MINCEINHKKIEVEEGTSIIDAADQNGIYIPRFCYHKKLSVVANCRMCLVEIEGGRKPLPACATLVTDGMKVFTQSKAALDAQRAVMEFLLINHPLDCPICDQGGQCELQDLAMGFGHADSDFTMRKHTTKSLNLGPLIATDMTRCIRCTRCIRVGTEICGEHQMGATQRGVETDIGPYIAQTITSPLSGNMIDVCPVGALTSKPDAAESRPWELYEHPTVSNHDCWGTHTFTHTKGDEYSDRKRVMRIVPRECESINESWIADRDRFSYESYEHASRAVTPMVKRNGQWVKPGLEAALLETVDRLTAVIQQKGADRVGAICSANANVEEGFVLQKLMRALGSNNIDHRNRMLDLQYPQIFASIAPTANAATTIESSDYILLIGSHLPHEVPLANVRVLKAFQNDARIDVINMRDDKYNYAITEKWVGSSEDFAKQIQQFLNDLDKHGEHTMAAALQKAERPSIILGHAWQRHPEAMAIYQALKADADKGLFTLITLTEGANSFGLVAANVLPTAQALNTQTMLGDRALDACVLLNVEPELDCLTQTDVIAALKAMPLVICITPFVSKAMLDYADVILPAALPFEMAGTTVNAQGEWQFAHPVTIPLADAKPAYKLIQALAKLMSLDGFDYEHAEQIIDACKQAQSAQDQSQLPRATFNSEHTSHCTFTWPMLRVDAQCRRSEALQALEKSRWENVNPIICMHADTATKYGLTQNDYCKVVGSEMVYQCVIDPTVPNNTLQFECGIVPSIIPHSSQPLQFAKES